MKTSKNPEIEKMENLLKQTQAETEKLLADKLADKQDAGENNQPNDKDEQASSSENETATPAETSPDNNEKPQNIEDTDAVNAGMSNAYAGVLKRKEPPASKDKSSWPQPPKREKSDIKVADGKDIMEVFWNEMWKMFENMIDWTVDRALDFVTFVLYPSAPKPHKDKEVEKADAFSAGQSVSDSMEKEIDAKLKISQAAYAEIKQNLQKVAQGGQPEWKLIKNEPPFFSQLVDTYKKAQADSNSAEAKKMERFEKMPTALSTMAENTKKIAKIMAGWSTMEEFVNSGTKEMEIKAAKEKYKKDKKGLKEEIAKIEKFYSDPKTQQEKMEKNIADKMRERMQNLYENINKIREKHENDPEKVQATTAEYIKGISGSLKSATESIYVQMYQNQKDNKSIRAKANEDLASLAKAVNEFSLGDEAIGQAPKAKNKTRDINAGTWTQEDILQIIGRNVNSR